jgi:hypothetical protein
MSRTSKLLQAVLAVGLVIAIVMQGSWHRRRQIMAVFGNNKPYAFSIGADEWRLPAYLFRRDAVHSGPARALQTLAGGGMEGDREQRSKPGMNELQAWFAIGVGVPEGLGTSNRKTVNYPNCGHPVKVIFEKWLGHGYERGRPSGFTADYASSTEAALAVTSDEVATLTSYYK